MLLGALGPVMTRLAAEKADGLTILPFCSEALLRASTFPAIVEGLAGAVRSRDDLEIVCGAIVGLGDTDEELEVAKERVKALLGFYGSTAAYRRVLASVDREEVGPLLAARVRAGDFASLSELIDDELVELLAVVGRPSDVAVRLTERFGWLADRLALFFPSEPSGASLSSLTDALIV